MRTVTEIHQDYSNLCVKAGHLQYSLYALQIDLDLVNEQLKDLNVEGAAAQKAEAERQVENAQLYFNAPEVVA